MIIRSRFKDYKVNVVNSLDFLKKLTNQENTQYVIDKKVYELYKSYFTDIPQDRLYLVEAIEDHKNIETVLNICSEMTNIPAKRNARLVSIGGGIIQDITGFVANVLYRGIAWTFVPTTLLAGCDSCIGGKTSLNYNKFKNLLGTFYPPDEIYICPVFFKTLSQRDFESGLGEVVKFNIMAGKEGLENIENNIDSLLKRDEICLNKFIETSLKFKKEFIEVDEFDKGERIKLNFAHTFGHAIESVTSFGIPHGTAVAIGMIMANYISEKRGLLSNDIKTRSEKVLLKVIHIDEDLRKYSLEQFITAIRKDKKQTSDNLTAVLMTNTPKDLKIVHDIQSNEVKVALDHFLDLMK